MSSNTSEESHITLRETSSAPLNSMEENQHQIQSQSEHMIQLPITLPTSQIGEIESNQILMPSEPLSQSKKEINSVSQLPSLKSHVKPHVLLEKLPEPRILKVSKDDIQALAQVIAEFQEQIAGF
jgi:hypothetical protein